MMETIEFINEVNKLKQANVDTYRSITRRITADFRLERATTKSYNGRQILELLQNCDDALTESSSWEESRVEISLDTKNQILSIANFGEPFSIDGIGSLLIANTSSKGKEFIGNKGLGFRAILNWSHEINVLTRGCKITFSKDRAQKAFESLILESEQQELRKDNADYIEGNEVPLAVLSMPEVRSAEDQSSYSTVIEIKYKESKEEDIKKQLNELNTKLLLFLNFIKKLTISYTDEGLNRILEVNREVSNPEFVFTNDGAWHLADSGDQRYETEGENEKFYRIKIAWQDSLNEADAKFYTFFPTAVPTELPVLIHGTFDLDPTRNYLNKSDDNANQIILQATAELMLETAKIRLCHGDSCNWDAFRFMFPQKVSSNKMLAEFYTTLNTYRAEEAVIPCVDGCYRNLQDVVYLGDEFSNWIIENQLENEFSNFIVAKGELPINITSSVGFEVFHDILDQVNERISISARVDILRMITMNQEGLFDFLFNQPDKLPLLLDVNDKPVSVASQVFTKDTESAEYDLPDFIGDIAFISKALYAAIKEGLKEQMEDKQLDTEKGRPSRAVKRLLSPVVNIGSDDITDVIQHIVSQTNRRLEEISNDTKTIKKMVKSLYSIFIVNTDRKGTLSSIQNIPLVTREKTIRVATKLNFGKEFKKGVEPELILGCTRKDSDYLIGNEFWELNANGNELELFFTWLNVNHFVRYLNIEKELGRYDSDPYTEFIITHLDRPRKDTHKTYKVQIIDNIEGVLNHQNFTIEHLITWVAKDQNLRISLTSEHSDIFSTKLGKIQDDFTKITSFIKFHISVSGITRNVFANIPVDSLKEFRSVDFNCDLFRQLNLRESEIMEAIYALGIKTSFNDIRPDEVYHILASLPASAEAQKSQSIYKLIYEYFKNNEGTQLKDFPPQFEGMRYFCRQGGIGREIAIKPIDEVYYSDNKLLPQSILDRYWFINLPRRIGENRVKKFFGVQLIKDFVDEIKVEQIELNNLNEEFNKYLDQLKPIILCYRLESLKQNESIKAETQRLKSLHVKLVKDASFRFAGAETAKLGEGELLPSDKEFILRSSIQYSLTNLRNDKLLCDAIAELFSILFKVQDLKNTFRRVFKDGFGDSMHLIKTDDLNRYYEEAVTLLGVSPEEKEFWQSLFPKEELDFLNREVLKKQLVNKLGMPLSTIYENMNFSEFSGKLELEFLSEISQKTGVSTKYFLKEGALEKWHKLKLVDKVKDLANQFEEKLWHIANVSDDLMMKKDFFKKCIDFEDAVDNYAFTSYLSENQFELFPDYFKAIRDYAKNTYGIDLQSEDKSQFKAETKYRSIIAGYSFGMDLADMENIIKQDSLQSYSLMYFDGFEDRIKEACEAQQTEFNGEKSNVDESENMEGHLLVLKNAELKAKHTSPTGGIKKGGSYSHTTKSDRKKARAGKKEENKVFQALKEQGFEVRRVSQKRDSKHYDLEYKEPGKEWRFLEVKKDSGGYFFLSAAEKETALSNEYSDRYDVAIVNGDEIHLVKCPFELGTEEFENNSNFYAEPTEFLISFSIKEE
ncbi:sacsin N-terminal ATP-binding-like domain-containing protein [Cyclobacterium salsum]|uniref:sacsin N-terminal ATP-binding-like domain-containing protein n=1 Tax=Cyclobacterium salsum TaxID=2666329 RepID=UPI001390D8B9|nr:DUF3883 domain-containing protein [Cyclobacterium salsum]